LKKTIYIVFFLISLASFAQTEQEFIDRQIENIESQFNQKGITDYFILRFFWPGASYVTVIDNTRCDPYPDSIKYVFWKEGGKNWIKRVSECGVSSDVQLTDFKPLDFFVENITRIEKDNVLRYSYKPDLQVGKKTHLFIFTTSHSSMREFKFHAQNGSFTKHIDTFNLTNAEDKKNLNFAYNNSLPVVILSNECKLIIEKLEEKRIFETIIKID